MAAIWQGRASPELQALRTCAIVTTAAAKSMGQIRHRLPVILSGKDWPLWLGAAVTGRRS